MRLMPGTVDEILRVEALTHEPSLHVDLYGQNRINPALSNVRLQGLEIVSGAHQKLSLFPIGRLDGLVVFIGLKGLRP